jgi:hypothetical protein
VNNDSPILLSAHRNLIVAEGVDGLRYEITRDPSTHPEFDPDTPERQMALSFTPEEARRVSTYMTAIGWRRVRVVPIPLTTLRSGERHLLIDAPEGAIRIVRFAAAGSIACAAVTDGQAEAE